jgi:caffeoyl-CoA O-methyltransferase
MKFIDPSIENYAIRHSSTPSAICDEIQIETQADVPMPQMLSGQMEGSLLGFLVRMINPKTILEIGTYTGYCTLNLAENAPADCKVYTLDVSDDYTQIGKKYWKTSSAGDKIHLILGPALDSLNHIDEELDFVFIDADKTNYMNYLKATLPKLSKNGIIAIDNVLWSGKVLEQTDDADTKAISVVNDFVAQNDDLYKTMLPIRDGILLIQKKA